MTLGKLTSIDEPVHAFFPEWRQGRKRDITVRMLMEHTSGLQNVPMTTLEIYPSPDFVQLALCAELDAEPGTTFAYNNKAVNLLAGIVERADDERWFDAMDAPARAGSESALMWWHLFDTRIEVTEDHLSALDVGGAGAEVINLFQGLRGEHRSVNKFFVNILK